MAVNLKAIKWDVLERGATIPVGELVAATGARPGAVEFDLGCLEVRDKVEAYFRDVRGDAATCKYRNKQHVLYVLTHEEQAAHLVRRMKAHRRKINRDREQAAAVDDTNLSTEERDRLARTAMRLERMIEGSRKRKVALTPHERQTPGRVW